jgi:hypothetical protein
MVWLVAVLSVVTLGLCPGLAVYDRTQRIWGCRLRAALAGSLVGLPLSCAMALAGPGLVFGAVGQVVMIMRLVAAYL